MTKIYSNELAFAALRSDGTVRAWGESLSMLARLMAALHGMLNDGWIGMKGTVHMVAMLMQSWHYIGGVQPGMCNGTRDGLRAGGGKISSQKQRELVNVTKIYSNNHVFVVLRSDGTFRAWGHAYSMPPRLIVALHGMLCDGWIRRKGTAQAVAVLVQC